MQYRGSINGLKLDDHSHLERNNVEDTEAEYPFKLGRTPHYNQHYLTSLIIN